MARGLMDTIRHALGLKASDQPPMSPEQQDVAERLDRIKARLQQRQDAIDVQIDALQADRADTRRHH